MLTNRRFTFTDKHGITHDVYMSTTSEGEDAIIPALNDIKVVDYLEKLKTTINNLT